MRCPARELCPHSGIQYTGLLCSRFFRLWFCFTARCTHDPGRLLLHGCCAHNAGRLFGLRGKRRFQFRLGLGRLFRLQQGVQRVLQQDAVAAALRAVHGILLLRVEGTAGAVPAIFKHLRLILQLRAVHAGFQRLFQLSRQALGGRQAHALDAVQMHHPLAVVHVAQRNIHAGDGLCGNEHRIVHAKQFAGLYFQVTVLEPVLAQDHAVHALALEVDLQRGQGHLGNILEGQADRVLPADITLEQLHADELHRAAGGVIVCAGPCDRVKIFLHDTRSFPFGSNQFCGSCASGVSGAAVSGSGWAVSACSAGSAVSADSAVSAC